MGRSTEVGARLRLRLLGGFAAFVGETRVPESAFARRKARALLKLLALQPDRRLHRDQAIEDLWPSLEATAASAQLYKAVHHVRQALGRAGRGGEGILAFREGVLALVGEVETDVAVFEQLAEHASREPTPEMLRRAVAAYSGELLPSDRYEEWTLAAREALQDRLLDLLHELGSVLVRHRQLGEAADAFRQALALDPTREEGHRGLMQVYALEGSRDRAARQFRTCVEVVERELGAGVSPETEALYEEIETGALGEVERVDVPVAPAGLLPPLVGRDEETAAIVRLLDGLANRRGVSITIEGPAGIGKMRLAHEVLQRARTRGQRVAYGTAG